MNSREHLLLATAIVEWSNALAHLHALREYGPMWDQVVSELEHLILQWPDAPPTVTPSEADRVIAAAAAHATAHIRELDDLLDEK